MTGPLDAKARDPVILLAAPNGAKLGRDAHPGIPITSNEIAECAAALLAESVSVLHLHVRDENDLHTLSANRYMDAMRAVHSSVSDQLIIQVTTEAVGRYKAQEQMHVVRELRPEAVSLALRELCPDSGSESQAAEFFAWLRAENIWPQYILYSAEEILRFEDMRRRGVFADDSPFCLLVLGRSSGTGEVSELEAMLASGACDEFPWAACCFGSNEFSVMQVAIARGGHARIGFENNLQLADGRIAKDNAELVTQFASWLRTNDYAAATAVDIREKYFN